jgi:hypothetical protein
MMFGTIGVQSLKDLGTSRQGGGPKTMTFDENNPATLDGIIRRVFVGIDTASHAISNVCVCSVTVHGYEYDIDGYWLLAASIPAAPAQFYTFTRLQCPVKIGDCIGIYWENGDWNTMPTAHYGDFGPGIWEANNPSLTAKNDTFYGASHYYHMDAGGQIIPGVPSRNKGDIHIDQLMFQHTERMQI